MRCFNHPEKEALAFCKICGKCLCRDCYNEIDNIIYCKKCSNKVNDSIENSKLYSQNNDTIKLSDYHLNLGSDLESKGLIDDAISEYKKSIDINSNNDKAHYNLGYCYYLKILPEYAVNELKKAIQINPNNHNYHVG